MDKAGILGPKALYYEYGTKEKHSKTTFSTASKGRNLQLALCIRFFSIYKWTKLIPYPTDIVL